MTTPLDIARRRRCAWLRVLDAVAVMRDTLAHRLWREDPDDTHLAGDIQTWCELSQALTDFLKSKKVKQ